MARAGQDCTTGPFVKGADVYDGSGSIGWTTAKSAGIDFAVIKASQGTYDTDSTFAANWAGAKAAGVLRAPYHFLDPTESGVSQAQFFLHIIGALSSTDLPPVLDIECPTSNTEPDSDNCLGIGKSGAASGSAITTVMNDWLTTVKAATGKTPVVYSYGSYFADDNIDTTGLESYPLWIAYPTTSGCFDFPGPWTKAAIWQYDQSGTVAGIGSGVDLDYFLGTMTELQAFAASGVALGDAGHPSADAGHPSGDAGGDASTGSSHPDAGTPHDGGTGTGGHPDSGAGSRSDAGVHDSGMGRGMGGHGLDGGPFPGGDVPLSSSGGCMTAPRDAGSHDGLGAGLLVLGGIVVRRRKTPIA